MVRSPHNLRRADVCRLLDCVEQLYKPSLPEAFPAIALEAVASLFPETVRAVDFISVKTGAIRSTIAAETPERTIFEKGVEQFIRQNPLVSYVENGGEGDVLDLSDFVGRAQLEQTELYEHVMAPLGIGRQIVLRLDIPEHVAGMTINRGWGARFSEKERFFAAVLRSHFARAYANSVLYAEMRENARFARNGWDIEHLSALGLTRREVDVLSWIAEGKRDSEIATILSIGLRTVHTHVANIIEKLGVETRTAAVRAATLG